MNIKDIKDTTKFIILTTESYRESTGYERDGEFGSRQEYVYVKPFDTEEKVHEWILNNPITPYKLIGVTHPTVKKTVSIDININHE